jgi:undecaprenyl-diphosphatase
MGPDYLKAVILGIIQGITEFLPVSSKGHLVILREPLNRWLGGGVSEPDNLPLIVALHIGTLFSILWVYRSDLIHIKPRLAMAIVIATLPLVAAALLVKDHLDAVFGSPLVAGCGLLVTSVILFFGHRIDRGDAPLEETTLGGAVCVGLFQILAIGPGISRSGTTMVGGLVSGMRRDAAANFSFLIAIPAICGATVLMGRDILSAQGHGSDQLPALLVGAVTSFVVGLGAIRWLLRMVVRGRLHWFAWYCAVAGLATIAWQLAERASTSSG